MPPQLTIRGDVLPEKQAAGPPVVSTQDVFSLLQRCLLAFRKWRRGDVSLHELSDRELADIGLTRGEIDCIDVHGAIDRLRDECLWHSRGVI